MVSPFFPGRFLPTWPRPGPYNWQRCNCAEAAAGTSEVRRRQAVAAWGKHPGHVSCPDVVRAVEVT